GPAAFEGTCLIGEIEGVGGIDDLRRTVGDRGDVGHDPARRHTVNHAVADDAARAFRLEVGNAGCFIVDGVEGNAAAPIVGDDLDQPARVNRANRHIVIEIYGAGRAGAD